MKKYEEPILEILILQNQDVITSTSEDMPGNGDDWNPGDSWSGII